MGVAASSGPEPGTGQRPAVRLDIDRRQRVGTIVIDRPPLNGLDLAVWQELAAVVREAGADPDVRAILVRGGGRAFATGIDVGALVSWDAEAATAASALMQTTLASLAALPAVSIAVVTGYALGGGCELALACDLRFAADNAKIGLPEVLVGAMPAGGGTQRLARLVGPGRAKEIALSGRMVDMVEAPRIGLVDRVLPADAVLAAATELAGRLAAGPASLGLVKRAIDEGIDLALDDALLLERRLFSAAFATEDLRTGVAAFLADGPGSARFQGR